MNVTKVKSFLPRILVCAISLVFLLAAASFAQDYTFKVHNNSGDKIVKILVSEDGNNWGFFDIGSGIPAGKTMELAWDNSTNNEECKQYFKAVFSDNSESEPVIFDFCEQGLILEFE